MTRDPQESEHALQALSADFDVHGEVARGGMSVVYRARDRVRGIEVALKVVHAKYLNDEDALARFAREARVALGLEHQNIVRTYELRELSGDSLALVMQFVDGRTLRQTLRELGRLPVTRAERILRDIADALSYAHRRGIVHRDVKPENIFIDSSGIALLSDFGIALSLDAESHVTRTGVTIGTPNYMSPEQIDNLDVDGRADLYSLALVGWEMLAGTRPWEGENLYAILHEQKTGYLPLLDELREDVPASYLMAIEGAMAKEPDGRWARAEEMSEQLAEAPLRSATRRRRAIAHGLGIYAHSKAAKDEATIRVRLPKVAPPEQASRGAPDLGESASPAAGPSPTESPRRAKLLLAIVAVLVLGVATLLALNARSSVAPIASSAMAPRADAASALATPPEIAQLVRLADSSAATGSIGDMVDAIEDYERALSMGAPRQPVLGRLALTYAFLAEEGANRRGLNTRQVHAKAIALTDSAIRLPTPTTEAWLARATLRQLADDASPSEIRAAIRRASIANPSHPEARRLVALTPAFLGNIAEAETQLRAVTSASSVSPRAYRDLVQLLLAQGEFEAARTVADRGIKAYPRMGALYPLRARATTALGELRAAWADAETGALLGEHAAAAALYVLLDARAGELTSARVRARALVPRRVASRPPAMPPTQTVPFATAFVAVGDSATALDLLQRSSPKGARFCLELRSPELHPLRGDPRFRRIAQECASGTR